MRQIRESGIVARLSSARITSALIIALCSSLLGIGFSATQWGQQLQERYELDWLFSIRGVRPPPDESIIIAIDKYTSDALNLPFDTRKWPRTLHAALVQGLHRAGARTVVYDLHFIQPRQAEDEEFAAAMRRAGNVLIPEFLDPCVPSEEKCQSNLPADYRSTNDVTLYQLIQPTPVLAAAAAAAGPFTLSDSNRRVSHFHTINSYAGDRVSLPMLALIQFALEQDVLSAQIQTLVSSIEQSPADATDSAPTAGSSRKPMRKIVNLLQDSPGLFHSALARVVGGNRSQSKNPDDESLASILLSAITPPVLRFINFTGPAKSIRTIRFSDALGMLSADAEVSPEVKEIFGGKAVFVGLSSDVQRDQRDNYDYFDTVFSDFKTGGKLSGIEILATSFSNLLHRETLRPVSGGVLAALIVAWGLLIAFLARLLTPLKAAAVLLLLCIGYLALAVAQFESRNLWLPILAPLIIQATFTLFTAVLVHHWEAKQEFQRIHNVFNQYLPEIAINRLVHEGVDRARSSRTLFGVCLFTDAEGYTSIAEALPSSELQIIEEEYKSVIKKAIEDHAGIISDSHGDSVLAFWASRSDEPANRRAALEAAITIDSAVEYWNATNTFGVSLPTRIGLHCGELTLTRIGKEIAYESRLVGDIVNTASRLEALNKHLGSRKLASAEMIAGVEQIVSQYVGRFVFKGKTNAVDVHRILGYRKNDLQKWARYIDCFSAAVRSFQAQKWQEAVELFGAASAVRPGDPVARWYLQQIDSIQKSTDLAFDGTIKLTSKRPDE